MKKIIFYILYVVVSCKVVNSQTYNFTNYNVSDGIEQSDILTVSQSFNGYLLYGSNGGGLGVYDGYAFKSIKEKHGLSNNIVFSIDVSNSGQIWVATKEGISLITKDVTSVVGIYAKGVSFYSVHVNKSTNEVWFGSGQGLFKYNVELDSVELVKTKNDVLNTSFINTIYSDSDGNLWIGTKNAGVFFVQKKGEIINFSESQGLASNYVKTIIEGKKGDVLVGTLDGLNLIKNNIVTLVDLPKADGTHLTFTSATNYKNQIVLGALNSQLYFIEKDDLSVKWIAPENGFTYKKTWALYTDHESNLWIGTIGSGIVKFNPIFTYYNNQNGLLNDYINAVFETEKKKLFIGYNGGIDIIEDNKILKTLRVEDLGFSNIYQIKEVQKKLFFGTNKGLYKYVDEKTVPIYFLDKDKKDENIYFIHQHKEKVFVGGKTGFYELANDTLYSVKNSPQESIYSVVDYKEAVYLASDKGIYKYSNNKFEFFSKNEGIVCGRARSFKVDSKYNLWIGTSDGVYLFNGKSFKKIDETSGLTSENIYLMEIDDRGNIWLGSNKGLDRVNIESAYQYWNNSSNKISLRNYSKNEGFNGIECNLNAVYRNKKNQLYFGTINGLYKYHSENDIVNNVPPILSFKNLKLNFEEVDWTNFSKNIDQISGLPLNLELKYNDNNLIFEFVGVSLTNPDEVYYQYKLEGLDENWLPLTKDRKAVYTAIPHGNYTFRLKAKNSDDVWTEVDQTFSFTISPPWYKTTWFYISAVLTILLLGYTILVVRTRNLKKTQIILTTKVEERTKELREEKEKVESVNSELAEQKKVVEVVNKNITDSINYAKKIQEAILPKPTKLEELKDSVAILYLPKDVVSGDFYWYEKVDNKLIFATADCTGHGVPGAFMSMIGVNNLNQIIVENKITSPDKILKELNIAIKKVLKQDDEDSESRDGMDISISCFDLDKKVISYAGAFRPLLYIRNNELHELKGSRQPIGGSAPIDFEYELSEFEYLKDDVYYMFSDGFPDQFGGPKGKKFMNKQLKDVFMKIYKKEPITQKELLKQELVKWMGDNEQIDDVLVMCVKI
ncbi:MAG: two-component regulator propeller domain-containing protein [Flavobacteriales bacterium]